MSSVIFKAINSYRILPPKCNPAWYFVLEKTLTNDTKNCVEKKGLHLQVLAELISQTMNETRENTDQIERIFVMKLNDEGLIDRIAKNYNVCAYP